MYKDVSNRFQTRTYELRDGYFAEIQYDSIGDSTEGPVYNLYVFDEKNGTKLFLYGSYEYQRIRREHQDWDDIEGMMLHDTEHLIEWYEDDMIDD